MHSIGVAVTVISSNAVSGQLPDIGLLIYCLPGSCDESETFGETSTAS